MLKVIANLITQSAESNELMRVKKAFLLDIINMCRDGKDNRRTILQMSVWQEWLISISYVFPKSEEEVSWERFRKQQQKDVTASPATTTITKQNITDEKEAKEAGDNA
ncbi:hypothetical protein ANCDUO_09093, partial [Ancylostoma duodenale]